MRDILLVGNPNCGKTTLFNLLTGKREYTGNRAGVTVESVSAKYKKDKTVTVTDLPGTYSVRGYSPDEKVVTEYLSGFGGVIVNVVDGTNLTRNLALTRELVALGKPIVVAVNFSDEMERQGIVLTEKALSDVIGVPVVKISARKKVGIDRLIKTALSLYGKSTAGKRNIDVKAAEELLSKIKAQSKKRKTNFSDRADKVLMNAYIGIPLFIATVFAIYVITERVGGFFGGKIGELFAFIEKAVYGAFKVKTGAERVFGDLICSAVIKGVGAVVSFLPQITILFILLTLMEESGYSSRAAYIADGFMAKIGLNGKSLVSFGVSCGCAVSGIMATRTIENDDGRKATVFLSPFMPCSAKTAVFAWFTGTVFNGNALVFTSIYFLSAVSVAVFGKVLNKLKKNKDAGGIIMELPPLRLPSFRSVINSAREKTAEFMLKAGSLIFLVSVCVWLLSNFGVKGYTTEITDTFLYYLGSAVKYIFLPLGFGSWQASVAAISGLFARESIIETLVMLSADSSPIFRSYYSAYAFLVFITLAPPCISALAVAKRELADGKSFFKMLVFQFSAAYVSAFTVNAVGYLAEKNFALLLSLTSLIFGVIISVKTLKRTRCKDCGACGVKKCGKREKANTTI